ncbi:MAG: hypothetical protein ABL907_11610 [Hyphomicrobium sp.]
MSEPDYGSIPAIELTQWRAGRILSDADIAMLEKLLKEHDDEMNAQIDNFSAGRDQAIREIGGQELVDIMDRGVVIDCQLAIKRASIRVAEKLAALNALTQ